MTNYMPIRHSILEVALEVNFMKNEVSGTVLLNPEFIGTGKYLLPLIISK